MALKEVAIAARSFGAGRAQAGDVICVRDPRPGIGAKEGRDFIWLLVDEADLAQLATEVRGDTTKYRYNIDLATLGLDTRRAGDPDDWYQPFRESDARTGLHARSDLTQSPTITDREQLSNPERLER